LELLDDTYREFALAHRDASTLPNLTFLADDLTDQMWRASMMLTHTSTSPVRKCSGIPFPQNGP
jgi:hypothetical protein